MTELQDLSQATADPADLGCDVCIIGSGCGGATAARVLAEAGKDVILLEEGGDFTGSQLTQRDAAMYDQLYAERGGRTTEDGTISVLSGRVLGGGGVINASDVVPIHPETWAFWRQKHGLTQWTDTVIAPAQARALADLSAHPIAPQQVNRNNQILQQGAQALGFHGEVMQHNRGEACQGLGTCLIGCPLGAKHNPRKIAIPKAMAAGARVLLRGRAVRIDGLSEVRKTVTVRTMDSKGYREQFTFRIRARVVIVAANPMGTVHLLRKSGVDNAHLGQHLSLQPQIPILAEFAEPVNSFDGIPQSYAVTEFERYDAAHGFGGFRIEGIFGTPGILGSLVPVAGGPGKEMMARIRFAAAALLLLPDESVGEIALKHGRPLARYTLTDEYRQRGRKAIEIAAKIYFAAGAKSVSVPNAPPMVLRNPSELRRIDGLSLAPATLPLISAHQQGGTRMAANPSQGVVDATAQVFGTRDVYVFDSSWYPSTSSSHTMTPILTTSHALSARLLAEWPKANGT